MRNVLASNHYVKVYCKHCKEYIFDLNTLYKGNVVSSQCSNCGKTNYPHNWIEEVIPKNKFHENKVAVYFDDNK